MQFFSAKTEEAPGKPGQVGHLTYQLGSSGLNYIKPASFAEIMEEMSKWGKTENLERPAGFILQRVTGGGVLKGKHKRSQEFQDAFWGGF